MKPTKYSHNVSNNFDKTYQRMYNIARRSIHEDLEDHIFDSGIRGNRSLDIQMDILGAIYDKLKLVFI